MQAMMASRLHLEFLPAGGMTSTEHPDTASISTQSDLLESDYTIFYIAFMYSRHALASISGEDKLSLVFL